MAENDKFDDEYHFVDPDSGSTGAMDYNPEAGIDTQPSTDQPATDKTFPGKASVIRNALIVVVLIIIVMVVYPLIRTSLSHRKVTVAKIPPITSTIASVPVKKEIVPVAPEPVPEPAPEVSTKVNLDEKITEKLSQLETNQEHMQTEFVATNSQLSGINTNINEMMTKVSELNRIITLYATKVDEQSREIQRLVAEAEALKKARLRKPVVKKSVPSVRYYIQAVIPGRAWLLASNGATLTVREGTIIPGLGMVKMIDARQGRVLVSSGQVIRFSQEDS